MGRWLSTTKTRAEGGILRVTKVQEEARPIKKKRIKDADEESSRGKKPKISMKRIYKKGHCRYCGESGHTKRNCHKRAVDEESAVAANSDANRVEVNNSAPTAAVNGGDAPALSQDQVEIQLDHSQPILSEIDDSQQVQPPPVRPPKLPPKRKLSTSTKTSPSTNISTATTQPTSTLSASTPSAPSASTLPTSTQPASTETTRNLPATTMRFMPNPGFKPPRTKNYLLSLVYLGTVWCLYLSVWLK